MAHANNMQFQAGHRRQLFFLSHGEQLLTFLLGMCRLVKLDVNRLCGIE